MFLSIQFLTTDEVNNIDDGVFNITITDNNSKCETDTTMYIIGLSKCLMLMLEKNEIYCGDQFTFNAVPSSGIGTWTTIDDFDFNGDENNPYAVINTESGVYTFVWTEINGPGCESSDEVTHTFINPPDINAGDDEDVCGLSFELNAVGNNDDGNWLPTSGITFTDSTVTSTSISGSSGEYELVWFENDGLGCPVTDTVVITLIDIPTPDGGVDDHICRLKYNSYRHPEYRKWAMDGYWRFI